jgi:hypothetical protein
MLKTEQLNDGLRIEIQPRKGWQIIFNFLVLALWLGFFWTSLVGFIHRQEFGRSTGQSVGAVVLMLCGVLGFLYITLKALFYYEIVTVTRTTLRIQGNLLSLALSDKTYDNAAVSDLRYQEWSSGRSRSNGIRFDYNNKLITFARQATEADSQSLIDSITKVYRSSKPSQGSRRI